MKLTPQETKLLLTDKKFELAVQRLENELKSKWDKDDTIDKKIILGIGVFHLILLAYYYL